MFTHLPAELARLPPPAARRLERISFLDNYDLRSSRRG